MSDYLAGMGAALPRFTIPGDGEEQSVADNATAYGRQQNRRGAVAIYANDKLKKVARAQAG